MPVLFGRHCVVPILLEMARQHPALELQLSFSDRPVDVLEEGFDLAIRNGVLGAESQGLRARHLVVQRKVVCASPTYLAAHGCPQNRAELVSHSVVLYRHGERLSVWQLPDATGEISEMPLQARLQFDDLEVVAAAATTGLGLAWLPEWLVRERLRTGELVRLFADQPAAAIDCHALWPSSSHMPLRVRLAVDMLVEKLPGMIGESR
jgi:DNA-binding transcriptional LysR family regulator